MNPIVYDKFETTFENYGYGIIKNTIFPGPRVFEKLNGEYSLSFYLPADDPMMSYLQEENIVKYQEQLFIIRNVEEERTEANELIAYVECEHIFFELLSEYIESLTNTSASAQVTLALLLEGTRFTADAASVPGTFDIDVQKGTPVSGINQLVSAGNLEIKRDNFNVILREQIGSDFGLQFRYQRNNKRIKRTKDSRGVITRLYVYGKDGLTIEDVNDGRKYIDSEYINDYPRPKTGYVEFNDIEDAVELKAAGEEYLKTVEIPYVTYELDVVELKRLTEFNEAAETFRIGDWVTVIDPDLKINIKAQIVEYEEYPKAPWQSRVVVANFIPVIEDELSLLQEQRDTIQNILTPRGISTNWLDGVIDVLKNRFESTQSNWWTDENGNIIFEATDGSSAMMLAGEGFAIANSKVGGAWQWQTFGTGEGFTANLINAGQLRASFVQIIGEENRFYWDADNIYIINPSNQNHQVRIGKYDGTNYGIAFTTDGGQNWHVELGFNGLVTTRSDKKVRVIQNGDDCFLIQRSEDGGSTWVDQLTTDGNGILTANGIRIFDGTIEIEHTDGSKTVIDGESFRAYPDANNNNDFYGLDGNGLYRSYAGAIARIRDSIATGERTVNANGSGQHGSNFWPPYTGANVNEVISLTGANWAAKDVSEISITLSPVKHGTPQNDQLTSTVVNLEVTNIEKTANGIDITVWAGATYYRELGVVSGTRRYEYETVDFTFSYFIQA